MSSREPKALLLVYLTRSHLAGDRIFDQGNDPEMRLDPMTWGVCRANVRRSLLKDDQLFFIAALERQPPETRYFLTARFVVGELIGHDEALERFAGRPNVILDWLPPGRNLRDRATTYAHWWDELAGSERRRRMTALARAGEASKSLLIEQVRTIDGISYIHSHRDHHHDWAKRLRSEYVVANTAESKIVERAIPYAELAPRLHDFTVPE